MVTWSSLPLQLTKCFDHSIFAEPMFLASWLKQEKFALKAKFTSREKNCF